VRQREREREREREAERDRVGAEDYKGLSLILQVLNQNSGSIRNGHLCKT